MAMTPTVTDHFPTMGEGGYDQVMNMSGQRSPYTIERPKAGPTQPDMGGGNAGGRSLGPTLKEGMGPQFRPVATRGWAAPDSRTERNVRVVPSSVGNRDFWDARARAGE